MPGTLVYKNSRLVTRDQLPSIATPAPTATWRPIPHADLVDAIERELEKRDLAVRTEQYAVQRDGARLFGVMDLSREMTGEFSASLGLRTSNDKSMAVEIAVGVRVFVCDNLAFSGDLIALRRKHTAGFDLSSEIARAIDRYEEHLKVFHAKIDELRSEQILDQDAKALIFDAFRERILPLRFFPAVSNNYFHAAPDMTDVLARTRWGLHNAFTRSIREMAPAPAFRATTRLGRLFGLGTNGR
ncbi:MAG: DUF932 domain-containing protein [Planctomycetes bacterium]|nr:DUF932 domain-containing protein [Planctomycetota bacterium]MBI3825632.1 DUF932 domain-containing protein [Candidatus Rokubacteria bacterium]